MNSAKGRNTKGLKPFTKGDPRIWKHGQKSKAAVAATRDIQEWLSKVGEEVVEDLGQTHNEALARKLWERAVKGDMQAASIVLERILGKAIQPIIGELKHSGQVVFLMPRPAEKSE